MAVFVDDMCDTELGRFGRMKMSHMIADTHEELLAMADAIGVQRKWIQHEGTGHEHFDIAKSKIPLAVRHGARQVSLMDLGRMTYHRKGPNDPLVPPGPKPEQGELL